jgi:hypothetical protein
MGIIMEDQLKGLPNQTIIMYKASYSALLKPLLISMGLDTITIAMAQEVKKTC